MHAFFALISRMKHISRWSLMRNSERENVQEHSHMTAVLAHALAVVSRDLFGEDCDPGLAAAAALYHDATEIFTGDMPTPVKYLNPELTAAYRAAEKSAGGRLLASLPPEIAPAYENLILGTGGKTARLVHAADKLAAYIKCLEEERAGNREFRSAAVGLRAKLSALALPEVEWFMSNCTEAFGLTIDELNGGE
ncbi:MAG: 5'-deoxynucleotidase [Oscillospiraceae bacterium]|jgi:5'-deoxynucleotidase|nr:5'-deoxynucleotidase [Oscillospiraceae bacterium]